VTRQNWFIRHTIFTIMTAVAVVVIASILVVTFVLTVGKVSAKGNDLQGQLTDDSQGLAVPTTPSTKPVARNYNDPRTLEKALTASINTVAAENGPGGERVSSTACVSSGEHLFDCSYTWTPYGFTTPKETVVVTEDGSSYTFRG